MSGEEAKSLPELLSCSFVFICQRFMILIMQSTAACPSTCDVGARESNVDATSDKK